MVISIMMSIFGLRIKEDRMKKAIKKTCVVLLLFALLVSQVAASYSETGTLNEGTSAISAAERYLSNWAYNSYMYADKNLTLGTVLDAEVDPAKLTLATSEFMALRNDADGQENNISVAVSKMQANIQFMIDKATYFSTIRQYNGLQRTDFNTDYVVQRVDVQGNFAVIEVLENISFQYVGAEDSSFSQKEHTVSLIKVDGEWIVANVETKYDWFANEYKDTEYKISSIIAAEKQNIQAQAECSANEDSVVSAAPAEDEMVAEVLANASFARMYNKENAWKYAYTYATSTTTSTANSYYNTDIFNDYSGPDAGDCMNFASQAIYAGFSGSNNLTSVNAGTAPQDISFVNAHGTATLYNDEMESKALTLAHLEQVPVHSLKPYFGHTLGASGIIESIVCMHELKQGILFGTPGYETPGVPMPIPVYATHRSIPMKHCVKTASGFGGCNAAIVLSLPEYTPFKDEDNTLPEIRCTREVRIENSSVFINNELIFHSEEPDFGIFIRDTYKKSGGNNMKFYKMDDLCKLGYVAAEYLLKDKTFAPLEMGMLLANATSSLHTDIRHQQLIDQDGDRAASPAVFVYTLPNVVSGEICIRHKIQGENTFFITEAYQPEKLERYARIVMQKGKLNYCIIGWCELLKNTYKAVFKLIEKQ